MSLEQSSALNPWQWLSALGAPAPTVHGTGQQYEVLVLPGPYAATGRPDHLHPARPLTANAGRMPPASRHRLHRHTGQRLHQPRLQL